MSNDVEQEKSLLKADEWETYRVGGARSFVDRDSVWGELLFGWGFSFCGLHRSEAHSPIHLECRMQKHYKDKSIYNAANSKSAHIPTTGKIVSRWVFCDTIMSRSTRAKGCEDWPWIIPDIPSRWQKARAATSIPYQLYNTTRQSGENAPRSSREISSLNLSQCQKIKEEYM